MFSGSSTRVVPQYVAILVEITYRTVPQLYSKAGLGRFIMIKYKFHIHLR